MQRRCLAPIAVGLSLLCASCSDGVAERAPTHTPTATQSASATRTPTATPSSTSTPTITSTPTATTLPVLINIDFAFGCCIERVTLHTHLIGQGFQVVGTANNFTYDTDRFSLDLASCVINPTLVGLKELLVSEIGSTATTRTVRATVSDTGGSTTIPDGALYSCTFGILCTTLPATYRVANSNQEAHDIRGMTLASGGTDGSLVASVNCFMPTPTP